jgi:hypothetical protein
MTTPTKEQVIAAVEAEINPSPPGKMRIKPVALIAIAPPSSASVVTKNGGSDWVGASGSRRETFWSACTIPAKTPTTAPTTWIRRQNAPLQDQRSLGKFVTGGCLRRSQHG